MAEARVRGGWVAAWGVSGLGGGSGRMVGEGSGELGEVRD